MSKGPRNIGFFGGSFDPIHLGHLNLAIELSEKHKLDEVYFCPTGKSPFKKHLPHAAPEHRRAMVTAAISPLSQFTLLDLELRKTDPCYTIDTIKALQAMIKSRASYFLLLGEDALEQFHAWREVEELVKLASPLIGSREKKSFVKPKGLTPALSSMVEKGITPIPILEISSTEIRARVQKGLYSGHLLPAKVWDYIQQHQLYKTHEKRS